MGIDVNDGYEDLREHIGHDIDLAWYGDKDEPVNVSIECETCHVVLIDFDRPPDDDDEDSIDPEPDEEHPTFPRGTYIEAESYRGVAMVVRHVIDGQMVAVMVGDDREHHLDVDECTVIDRERFCGECGQIGCSHDGLDRSTIGEGDGPDRDERGKHEIGEQ